jgi:class 3 adenylate cyclase/TolB-like protein/outer membrane protein assembly factor BamD (BamD/ComL family)
VPQSRQLAAIMFTDIVGYTALMGKDEQKAFTLLTKNRLLQKPIIEQYNGRWIKEMGDGVMASFNTASDAVNAAVKIQQACNAVKDFQLKIGIHLGEVVFENDDVYGDGVNIASRIETLGVGSSVLFSKTIRDQVKNNAEFQITSLGSFEFKNVDEPVEVFALANPGFAVPQRDTMKGKLKEIKTNNRNRFTIITAAAIILILSVFLLRNFLFTKNLSASSRSIAILPFENLQKDSSLLYLSDGIAENIINRLSSFPGVKVFARSATFKLADSFKNISSVKKLLNADVVLTGQLQQNGDVYFLSCQLVDASNQNQVWGNKYEMKGDDISRIEDSIVSSLINPLRITLADRSKGLQNKPVNPQAYAEYLKGRFLSYGSTPEESEKALSHFREAIRIDPKYATAYAAIANEKIVQSLFSTASQKEIINEARTAIEAAKALDPNIPEIYTSEGALKFYYDWDWKGAVESYKKALQLDSGNATIYIRYSATLADVGRYKEALPLADKAVELDPVSISSLHNLGWTNLIAGNFQKSADAFQKALDLHPVWVWGYIKQAYCYVYLGQYDKAVANALKAEKLFGDGWGSELLQVALAFIYTRSNDRTNADRVIDRFLKYATTNKVEDPWDLSYIYYLKGDQQKANEWEEKSVAQRSPNAYLMNINIMYDKKYFESKPHQQVLKKMGFVK